jgi:hypothetical protein
VCVTFTKFKGRHGKAVRWFWTPEKAELQACPGRPDFRASVRLPIPWR